MDLYLNINSSKRNDFSFVGTIVIHCTKERLWNLITTPGHLKNVHPYCKNHFSDNWTGVGSTDTIVYKNDKIRNRTVRRWTPYELICLDVVDPVHNAVSFVEWKISNHHHNSSCLSIKISTDSYKNIPRLVWPFYLRFKLKSRHERYLKVMLMGIQLACQNQKNSHP
jgi:hypothetical protein